MSLALLFPPQGSQSLGMGRDLAAASPAACSIFEQADAALDWSVSSVAWEGPESVLNDTRQTQPCLVATSLACLAALREANPGLEPAFVAGHSVGEYAALVAGGALSLEDALRLVARRGSLMAETADGGMLAVIGLDRAAMRPPSPASDRPIASWWPTTTPPARSSSAAGRGRSTRLPWRCALRAPSGSSGCVSAGRFTRRRCGRWASHWSGPSVTPPGPMLGRH